MMSINKIIRQIIKEQSDVKIFKPDLKALRNLWLQKLNHN